MKSTVCSVIVRVEMFLCLFLWHSYYESAIELFCSYWIVMCGILLISLANHCHFHDSICNTMDECCCLCADNRCVICSNILCR